MQLKRFRAHRRLVLDPAFTERDTVSTLLVPEVLCPHLHDLLRSRRQSMAVFVRLLLLKYRHQLLDENTTLHHRCRRLYQRSGLLLVRRNFRPEPQVWSELGLFAAFIGVSRCYLFTMLLMYELYGQGDAEEGVPTEALPRYDLYYPEYIEYRERIHSSGRRATRTIRLIPSTATRLPLHLIPWPQPDSFLRAWISTKFPLR